MSLSWLQKIFYFSPLFIVFTLAPWVFNPAGKWIYELPKARVIYIGILLTMLITSWGLKKIHTSKLLLIVILYLAGLLITGVLLSNNPAQSFLGTYERQMGFLALLQLYISPFFLAEILKVTGTKPLFKMIAWGSLGAALLALSQYSSYSSFSPVESYGFRLYGSLGEPNLLGYYLVLTLFPVWQLFQESTWRQFNKYWYCLILLINSAVILNTGSRGAILAFILSAILLFIHHSKLLFVRYWKRTLIVGIALTATLIALIHQQLGDPHSFINLRILNNVTVAIRLEIWKDTLLEANKQWLLGHGLENLAPVFTSKSPKLTKLLYDPAETIDRAHNEGVDAYFSGGLVGVLLYFWVMGTILFYAIKLWRSKNIILPLGMATQFLTISSLGPVHSIHVLFLTLVISLLHLATWKKIFQIPMIWRVLLSVLLIMTLFYHIQVIVSDIK